MPPKSRRSSQPRTIKIGRFNLFSLDPPDPPDPVETPDVVESSEAVDTADAEVSPEVVDSPVLEDAPDPVDSADPEVLPDPGESRGLGEAIFTEKELDRMSHVELVRIILNLQTKIPRQETEKVDVRAVQRAISDDTLQVDEFIRLPANRHGADEASANLSWKVRFLFKYGKHPPLGIELVDDVVVGRASGGSKPDLDLGLYGGAIKSVSREHAILRPTHTDLLLLDLDSTNGTFCNGVRLTSGKAQLVRSGDTISFGRFHLRLEVVEQP